jgi:anti-anti-sigma factor
VTAAAQCTDDWWDFKLIAMELTTEQLADGVQKIALSGRMDFAGTEQIDHQFTAITATRPALIVVDLSAVSFLASIGMRTLLVNAKALALRGGHMALAAPQPVVEEALTLAGITALIPIYADTASACDALRLAAGGR